MTTPVTPQDWELLSAGQAGLLNSKEQARLEARLQNEPELQKAYDELRSLRVALRQMPRLRAPRSYTLQPEMGSRQSTFSYFPVFRSASIVASLLFILVLLGDLFSAPAPIIPLGANLPQPAAVELMQEAAEPAMESMEMAVEEAPVEATLQVESSAKMLPTGTPEPAVAFEAAVMPEGTSTPASEPASELGNEPEMPPPGQVELETSLLEATPYPPIEESLLQPYPAAEMDATMPLPQEEQPLREFQPEPVSPLLWIEIALLVAAILTGGAAVWLKRRA